MKRLRYAFLVVATALALGASVATAESADAHRNVGGLLPDGAGPSAKSVHAYGCAGSEHPGKHKGWEKQAGNERRNVGGTCPAPEDPPV